MPHRRSIACFLPRSRRPPAYAHASAPASHAPASYQFGYVFARGPEDRLIKTASHELGHGRFQLRHTFVPPLEIADTTDNLMSYHPTGTTLCKRQWDYLHDPQWRVFRFLQGEEEGRMANDIPIVKFQVPQAHIGCFDIGDNKEAYYFTEVFLDEKGKRSFNVPYLVVDRSARSLEIPFSVRTGKNVLTDRLLVKPRSSYTDTSNANAKILDPLSFEADDEKNRSIDISPEMNTIVSTKLMAFDGFDFPAKFSIRIDATLKNQENDSEAPAKAVGAINLCSYPRKTMTVFLIRVFTKDNKTEKNDTDVTLEDLGLVKTSKNGEPKSKYVPELNEATINTMSVMLNRVFNQAIVDVNVQFFDTKNHKLPHHMVCLTYDRDGDGLLDVGHPPESNSNNFRKYSPEMTDLIASFEKHYPLGGIKVPNPKVLFFVDADIPKMLNKSTDALEDVPVFGMMDYGQTYGFIFINETNGDFFQEAAHELGHGCYLGHTTIEYATGRVSYKNNLMEPRANYNNTLLNYFQCTIIQPLLK